MPPIPRRRTISNWAIWLGMGAVDGGIEDGRLSHTTPTARRVSADFIRAKG
jgi:hypothetical protein